MPEQPAPKIGFLITARLKSQRLPVKLMLDLEGRRVVERVIDRAKQGMKDGPIVICTSTTDQDKPLCDVAKENGIHCFQGEPEDVLQRLLDTCEKFGLRGMAGITGENPIFPVEHTEQVLRELKDGADLVKFKDMPIGCSIYGISRAALQTICTCSDELDTSMWGYLLDRPTVFDVRHLEVPEAYRMPGKRLTVDYPEDLKLMREIHARIDGDSPSMQQVMELLGSDPELWKINAMREQEDMDPESKQRIQAFFDANEQRLIAQHEEFKAQA